MLTVLCVDDNPKALRLLASVFQMCGYGVLTSDDPWKALELARRTPFDLVVLDYELPHMSGIALARRMKSLRPGVPLVLYSGSVSVTDEELRIVDAYVAKDETIDVLLHKLRTLLGPGREPALGVAV